MGVVIVLVITKRGLVTWEDGRCNSPSYNRKGFSYLGRWSLLLTIVKTTVLL